MFSKRSSQHSFAQAPAVNIPRSRFDRSFSVKDTMNFDSLWPILVDEVLPGDTFNCTLNAFVRFATMVNPIMDNAYVDFFFFYVPNRLLWTNWEKFLGSQDNPGDSISYTIPTISVTNLTVGDGLAEKMGIPLGAGTQVVNALPFRAYNLIYNQWFRNENITNSVAIHTDNGPDPLGDYGNVLRNKPKDYFTSCLPWPQKGTALQVPMSTTPVAVTRASNASQWLWYKNGTNTNAAQPQTVTTATAAGGVAIIDSVNGLSADPQGGLVVTPTNMGGTIGALRQAMQLQVMLERDARGGTRHTELLLAHFGVTAPDFRLQRPEFLGSGRIRIASHSVPQTSSTSGSSYRGDLSAFATGSTGGGRIGFSKSFVEHGYIIGLASATAEITYQRALNRLWTRSTRYDFYWPSLDNIGEQAVLRREIWANAGDGHDGDVFGYQERYAEYRYKPSEIHGNFRSNASSPLDSWHLAQNISSTPSLNDSFINHNTPTSRIKANSSAQDLICDYFFEYICARPMKVYSVPAGLGRF